MKGKKKKKIETGYTVTEQDRVEVILGKSQQRGWISSLRDKVSRRGRQLCPQPEGSINLHLKNLGSIKVALIHGYAFLWHMHLSIRITNKPTDSILQLKLPTTQTTQTLRSFHIIFHSEYKSFKKHLSIARLSFMYFANIFSTDVSAKWIVSSEAE